MYILSAGWSETLQGFRSHYHDAHELLYILSGEICVTVNGRRIHARAGELLIFSRFEEHAIEILSETYRRYTLLISPDISAGGGNYLLSSVLVNRSADFAHILRCGTDGPVIAALLEDMYREYRQKEPMDETVLDALQIRLLCQIYRIAPRYFTPEGDKKAEIVRRLQARFEASYPERFTLSELAGEYHVSASHLAHSFKKITGYSPMDYLMSCRISAAKNLLTGSEKSISQIVELCGFSDESNFSRTFRLKTGMTPSAFRKQNAAKHSGTEVKQPG